MLKALSVANLAIVEKAEVEFGPGLNVITGETGAGKSVLMGALELISGARAELGQVRDGAKEAEIEADFGTHVIRRVISANGRSKAWIDDEAVSIAELKDRGKGLIDVHGPRANQAILEEAFQRQSLDSYGGIDLSAYEKAWKEVKTLEAELKEIEAQGSEEELDLLRFQVAELEDANLSKEDETIADRHAAAAHATEIIEATRAITELLGGEMSATERLIGAQRQMHAIKKHFPEAEEWSQRAESLIIELQELSRSVADSGSRIEAGEEDLDTLDKRLTLVNKLKRKYKSNTIEELLEKAEAKRERLNGIENKESRLKEIAALIAAARSRRLVEAAKISERRKKAAAKLARTVTSALHDLGFLQAKFDIELETIEPEAYGIDRVRYMFEPNPGESARALADIASSGEIARVMLALKATLASHDEIGLLIFDEIDANIGGEVGKTVGEKLREVSRHHQVIAITHLPQSAVFGDKHFVVSKAIEEGRTKSRISEVTGEDRIKEVSRMLGGSGSVVRRHAEELLSVSH